MILAEVDGKYLTVSYEIKELKKDDQSATDDKFKFVFDTSTYKLIPMENIEVGTKRFNEGIEIYNNAVID